MGDVKLDLQRLTSAKTKKQQTNLTTVFVNCCNLFEIIWLYINDLLPSIINSVCGGCKLYLQLLPSAKTKEQQTNMHDHRFCKMLQHI